MGRHSLPRILSRAWMLSRARYGPRARFDSGRVERRVEASRLRWALFLAYLTSSIAVLERALRAHTFAPPPRAPRARFSFVHRASCRETGNNGGVRAAKLKPPTDFSYFADEPSLRSWLPCAKSPLGVSRFISAPSVYQPRAVHIQRYTGCAFSSIYKKILSRYSSGVLVDDSVDVVLLPQ